MKLIKFILVFASMFILQGCLYRDPLEENLFSILIENKTQNNAYFYYNTSFNLPTINSNNLKPLSSKDVVIVSFSERGMVIHKKVWIFIISESIINQYSIEEIQKQELYDKKYVFTLEEVKKMEKKLVYDGS